MSGESQGIVVGMRMRPFVGHEKGQKPCIVIDDNVINILVENLDEEDQKANPEVGPFTFDVVMDSSDPDSPSFCGNPGCYERMGKPLVESVFKGFNSCLFCYGQTGTGKTATIMGYPELGKGLLPSMLNDMILEAERLRGEGCTVKLTVQMFEVYNEDINDLLVDRDTWSSVDVKTRVLPQGVVIQGASEREVNTVEDCTKILDEGDQRKTVAATQMNPRSSRGHMVFKLSINKSGGPDGMKFQTEVYFADLAGHENIKQTAVTGQRLTELKHINSSLMYLQRAISALAKAPPSKPGKKAKVNMGIFRNSELTLLLANGLTGNCKAAVIVTLSPAAAHFDTSLDSIEFALEVKGIKMEATSTVTVDAAAKVKMLEAEVKELKAQLAAALAGDPASPSATPATASTASPAAAPAAAPAASPVETPKDDAKSKEKSAPEEELAALRAELSRTAAERDELKKQLSAAAAPAVAAPPAGAGSSPADEPAKKPEAPAAAAPVEAAPSAGKGKSPADETAKKPEAPAAAAPAEAAPSAGKGKSPADETAKKPEASMGAAPSEAAALPSTGTYKDASAAPRGDDEQQAAKLEFENRELKDIIGRLEMELDKVHPSACRKLALRLGLT